MDFEAGDAVYDFDSRGFHSVGHFEVVFLVESGFEFDEDGDFLVVGCGCDSNTVCV